MPKGPRGEKRPADAVSRAVMVARIATGEIEDEREDLSSAAAQLGSKGGRARAERTPPERRSEIARRAAKVRWQAEAAHAPKVASETQDQ
jgi:hypothetical protein